MGRTRQQSAFMVFETAELGHAYIFRQIAPDL